MKKIKLKRVMAMAPSTRGFGYAIMAGEKFVDWGNRAVKGKDRNGASLEKAEQMLAKHVPDVLVLADHKGTRRADRIITLTDEIAALATARKINVRRYTRAQVHRRVVGDAKATKYQVARAIAEMFPDDLKQRLPPKRETWMNDHPNGYIFEAVALALACGRKRKAVVAGPRQHQFATSTAKMS